MKTQKQIEEIKDFSPRDIAIQVMKAIEVADITQWNGKNVFEESEYEAIFQSIEDGVSLAVEQEKERIIKILETMQPRYNFMGEQREKGVALDYRDIISLLKAEA